MPNPLRDKPPLEVKLASAPLHRVLAVIQFPAILKISEERGIVDFQDKIRKHYPDLQREQELGVQFQMAPNGEMLPPQQVINNLWRFASTDHAWRITLSTQSVALETLAYRSRDDFLQRLESILEIFVEQLEPSSCSRIGIRYLNLLNANDVSIVKGFAREGLRSLSDTEISQHIAASSHSVTLDVPEGTLFARWGILPPNTVHDPNMLVPTSNRSWYLDMDCFSEDALPFEAKEILVQCRLKTERIYSFFRWAVSPDFIENHKDV